MVVQGTYYRMIFVGKPAGSRYGTVQKRRGLEESQFLGSSLYLFQMDTQESGAKCWVPAVTRDMNCELCNGRMLHTCVTGTSFFAITPGITLRVICIVIPLRKSLCPTPGTAISMINECPLPRAFIMQFAPILEWEIALLPLSCLAVRGPHLIWHGEEEQRKVGEAVELGEGEE